LLLTLAQHAAVSIQNVAAGISKQTLQGETFSAFQLLYNKAPNVCIFYSAKLPKFVRTGKLLTHLPIDYTPCLRNESFAYWLEGEMLLKSNQMKTDKHGSKGADKVSNLYL